MASRWSLVICSLVLSVCRAIPAPISSHLQSSREPPFHNSSISIFPTPEGSHLQGSMTSRPSGASVRASASGTSSPSINNFTIQTLSLLNAFTPSSSFAAQSSTPPPTTTETTLPPEASLQTLFSGAYLSNQWITTTPPGSSSATVVPVIIPPDLNVPIVLWNLLPGPPPGGEFPTLPHLEINAPKAPCIRIFGMSIGSCPSKPEGQNPPPPEPNPKTNPNPSPNPTPDPRPTQEPSQSLSRSSEASSSSCTSSMATVTSISCASLGISSSCTTAYTTKDGCDVTGSLTSTAACISKTTINGKTFCCPSTTVVKGSTVCAIPPLTVEDVLVRGTVRQESVGSVELMDQLRSYLAMQSGSLLASGTSQSLPQTVPSSGFTASAPSPAANSSILHSLVSASPGSQPIASLSSASSTVPPTAASVSAPGSGSSLPTASQSPPSSLSADTASSALSSSASSGTTVSASSSSASSGTTIFASSSSSDTAVSASSSSASSDTAISASSSSASSDTAASASPIFASSQSTGFPGGTSSASSTQPLAAYIASSQSVAAQPTAPAQCFPWHDINVLQDSKPDMDNFCDNGNSTLQDGTFWDPSNGAPARPNYGTTILSPATVKENNILAGFTIASDASPGCHDLFYPVSPNFATLACSAALKQILNDCPYNGGKTSNACGEWWTMTCPLATNCPVGCPGGAFGVGDSRCGSPW